jgi:hypothetical protein
VANNFEILFNDTNAFPFAQTQVDEVSQGEKPEEIYSDEDKDDDKDKSSSEDEGKKDSDSDSSSSSSDDSDGEDDGNSSRKDSEKVVSTPGPGTTLNITTAQFS